MPCPVFYFSMFRIPDFSCIAGIPLSLAAHLPFIARAALHQVSRVQLQAKRRNLSAQAAFLSNTSALSPHSTEYHQGLCWHSFTSHLSTLIYPPVSFSRASCSALQFITWIIPASPLVSNPFVSSDPSKHLLRYPRIHPTPGT